MQEWGPFLDGLNDTSVETLGKRKRWRWGNDEVADRGEQIVPDRQNLTQEQG